MSLAFEQFLAVCRRRCESTLPRLLEFDDSIYHRRDLKTLLAASHYSLLNGGKRIRPLLVYAAARAVDPGIDNYLLDHPACAMEMIHVYSLVHDDLPAMDDDDLRRGKASCHRAYDEATAILVGDGLQARAFEVLAEAPGVEPAQQVAMVKLLASAAGPRGMVGGQAIDIAATDRELSLEQLKAMHCLKTGALIRAALGLGGIVAGAREAQLRSLDSYGCHIGLAFQVVDDILDVEGSTAVLGKTRGKDDDANKPTYVKLMGLDKAKSEARQLLAEALESLQIFGESADSLRKLAVYIVERQH